MRIGVAADHGGFALKTEIAARLRAEGFDVQDFGALSLSPDDDYPDYIVPLARAVAAGEVERGVAFCGSGVGACVTANKVPGVRASSIADVFSAHQGVEDDDMNIICLGGRVIGNALAWDLTQAFLKARFTGAERHKRRLAKTIELEKQPGKAAERPPIAQVCDLVCRELRKEGIAENIVRRVESKIKYGDWD